MNTNFVEEMTNAGKTSYEAIQKLSAINTKALNELAGLQMALANIGFESGVEQMKLVSSIKDYNDFISAESEFASQVQDKILNLAQQASDVLAGSQDEVASWMKEEFPSFSSFEETFSTNTQKAAPKKTAKPKTSTKTAAKPKAKAKAKTS